MTIKLTLGTDREERKNTPVFSGVLKYAPAALAGVARISMAGNAVHNPGQPLHHARGKSNDHADCVIRHAMDVADILAYIERGFSNPDDTAALLNEVSQLAWRALMWSQELHEKYGGAPLAPGARLPQHEAPEKQKPGVPVWTDDDADRLREALNKTASSQSRFLETVFSNNTFGTAAKCQNCGKAWGLHSADGSHCPNPDSTEA
jgi:hypothetical protein